MVSQPSYRHETVLKPSGFIIGQPSFRLVGARASEGLEQQNKSKKKNFQVSAKKKKEREKRGKVSYNNKI